MRLLAAALLVFFIGMSPAYAQDDDDSAGSAWEDAEGTDEKAVGTTEKKGQTPKAEIPKAESPEGEATEGEAIEGELDSEASDLEQLEAEADREAGGLDPYAAAKLSKVPGVPQPEPLPKTDDTVATSTYMDGYRTGSTDGNLRGKHGIHGLAGFGTGCVIGPCACVFVPAIEALVNPGVPAGPWQGETMDYQQGYIDGYRKTVQKKRVLYSLVGASVGSVIGVGAGIATGAFAL